MGREEKKKHKSLKRRSQWFRSFCKFPGCNFRVQNSDNAILSISIQTVCLREGLSTTLVSNLTVID